jgi:hypothetical protein
MMIRIMPSAALFANRSLRVCYWNAEAKIVDAGKAELERHLKRLGDVKVEVIKALDAPEAAQADLLVVAAQKLAAQDFPVWLQGFRKRIQAKGSIWTPALILADVSFDVLSEILVEVTAENWYFDVVAPAHLSSLPIRVANLLRIHDHLHELKRYSAALDDINTKVKMLESQMKDLRK